MADTLIVTAYNRPESLIRCLESVKACNLQGVDIFVSHDARGPEMDTLGFRCVEQPDCKQSGDNIRFALQQAQHSRLVMFIEDDFIVEPGFVDWHRKVHEYFTPLISCADNAYSKYSNDPSGVILSHSHCHVRAGCATGKAIQKLLRNPWPNHFEEIIQKHLIKNKLLSVHASMPRAHDTGAAGTNLPERKTEFILRNPQTPGVFHVLSDLRWKWDRDYKAQAQWGL